MPDPVVTPNPTLAQLEPIRLPSWAVALIVIFLVPLGTAFLTDQDWKPVAAGALSAVVPLLVVSERARSKVVPVVEHNNELAATAEAAKKVGVAEGASRGWEQGREQGREDLVAELDQVVASQVEEKRVARAARAPAAKKAPEKKAAPRKAP